MRVKRFGCIAALILSVVLVKSAAAQPLADRVPGDAMIYVGWAGIEKMGPAFNQSHFKAVLDASSLEQLISNIGPAIKSKLDKLEGRQAAVFRDEILPVLTPLLKSMWRSPTAFYVGPIDLAAPRPMPRIALLTQAGADANNLADQINKLLEKAIPPDAPIKVKATVWPGDILVISTVELPPQAPEPLSKNADFVAAMKHVNPDPVAVAYIDTHTILSLVSVAITAGGKDNQKELFSKILKATGIGGLNRVVVAAGFDGKDWGTQAFIDAPKPRTGLLSALMDGPAIGDDLLKWAPKDTQWMAAWRLDFAGLLGDVRKGINELAPDFSPQFERLLGQAGQVIGMDVEKDLLAPLGGQWMVYNSQQSGQGILGITLVNPLRDSEKAKKALMALGAKFNELMAHEMRGDMTLQIRTAKTGDLEYHYLASPVVSPCWAIKGNNLYIGLYPQTVAGAAAHDGTAAKSLLGNPGFVAARDRIGVKQMASIAYMDLPALAPRTYPMLLLIERLAMGFADLYGFNTPPMLVPPLSAMLPHLSPSIAASWVDDAGFHARHITPFPGADLLAGEQQLVTVAVPMLAAITLPAYTRAREQAQAAHEMNQLRQVGIAMQMYANDNKGALPADLGAMLPYLNDNPANFVSPQRAGEARMPNGTSKEQLAKWVNQNSDFVYTITEPRKLSQIRQAAEYIAAYQKLHQADRGGRVGVLFLDGHVEMLPASEVQRRLEQQKEAEKK